MATFETRKVFNIYDMPPNVMEEFFNGEAGSGTAVRVFLTGYGYNGYPLARAWLLKNGAEESDEVVYVWMG